MKRLIIVLIFLGAGVFVISTVPCQADDSWVQIGTHNAYRITTDLPYIYTVGEICHAKIYRSTDYGANWELRCDSINSTCCDHPRAISVDKFNASLVFLGVLCDHLFQVSGSSGLLSNPTDVLYRSVDAGSTWTLVDGPGPKFESHISCVVNDPLDSNMVFQGRYLRIGVVHDYKVRRSTDRGVHWTNQQQDLPSDVMSLAFDSDDSDILYAGTDRDGVWKTTEASGLSVDWDSTGLIDKDVRSIVVDPTNTSILYAGTTDDVYRTSDAGASWTRIAQDSNFTFTSLALNPEEPNILYALRDDDYVYFYYHDRTTDWIDMSVGLPIHKINQLISDVNSPDTIAVYAATDSGVYYHEEKDKEFIRGDAKADDGTLAMADIVFLSNYVFSSGPKPPCMDAADADDDAEVDAADVVYLSNYLLKSGPAPPPPFGTFPDSCGTDPTADTLGCVYSPCYGQ